MPDQNLPSHIAFIPFETKRGRERKTHWREVGAMWPLRNGKGFQLVISPDTLSVSGRILLTERRDDAERGRDLPDATEI